MKKTNFIKFLILIGLAINSISVLAQQNYQLSLTDNINHNLLPNDFNQIDLPKDLKHDINALETLMRLETIQLLKQAQQQNITNNDYLISRTKASDSDAKNNSDNISSSLQNLKNNKHQPQLKSIYGVGNNLKAKVIYKQHEYVYKKGDALPIGITQNKNHVLLMTDFSDLCITLVSGDDNYDLCLNTN